MSEISLEDIENNSENYNVNNLSDVLPEDYDSIRFSFNTGNWIDDTFYFIEPNCLGGNYPTGSSLFHWKWDDDLLTNDRWLVELRYQN